MKDLVFADPSNKEARELCADALEQLGYQAESGTWRNAYLTGALELREGNQAIHGIAATGGLEVKAAMTPMMMLDFIRISTDANAAEKDDVTLNLKVEDIGECFYLKRTSGVLLAYSGMQKEDAEATITCSKIQLLGMMAGNKEAVQNVGCEGDRGALVRLLKYMTEFEITFNVVEP